MKSYTIIKEKIIVEKLTYVVKAKSASEALEMVEGGEIKPEDDKVVDDTIKPSYYVSEGYMDDADFPYFDINE